MYIDGALSFVLQTNKGAATYTLFKAGYSKKEMRMSFFPAGIAIHLKSQPKDNEYYLHTPNCPYMHDEGDCWFMDSTLYGVEVTERWDDKENDEEIWSALEKELRHHDAI